LLSLPAGIAEWNGEDSDKILDNAVIKIRLKKLLGKRNYAAFLESFETLAPIEKKGDILFSRGCLIHACQHLESAIAIDLANQTIHAAIYREDKRTKYFNESGAKTPKAIINWAHRLDSHNNNKK
jgi:hypothetical protein